MYVMAAWVAAAAWLAGFGAAAAAGRFPRRAAAGVPAAGPDGGPQPPALVDLARGNAMLSTAAYPATVCDLAWRGYLSTEERGPGQVWCRAAGTPPPRSALTAFEQRVLRDADAALAGTGSMPLEALAGRGQADLHGRWVPFADEVRAEARRRGLTTSRLPAAVRWLLRAGAGVVAAAAYLALHSRPHTGQPIALGVAFFAFITPLYWVSVVAGRDRLTRAGTALASQPLPPGTGPVVRPGPRRPQRASQPRKAGQPTTAWSSFTGEWREVPVPAAGGGQGLSPWVFFSVAVWLGLLCVPASFLPGMAGYLVPLLLAIAALAAGSQGSRRWAAARSLPSRIEFDGQVVARWVLNDTDPDKISGDEDTPQPCLAIDDGSRTWSFGAGWQEFRRVSIGDLVRVQTKPRTNELLTLTRVTPAGSQLAPSPVPDAPGWAIRRIPPPSQDHSPVSAGPVIGETSPDPAAGVTETVVLPAGLPLSEAEVSAALGQPVRVYRTGLPGWQGFIYRGASRTLSVTVTGSRLGEIGQRSGSRGGRAVPGIGEEAWQLNRGRTVVFRLGPAYGKVTLSGPSEPRLVARLAATAATRLTVDDDNPASHPGRDRCPQPDMGCPSGDHGC